MNRPPHDNPPARPPHDAETRPLFDFEDLSDFFDSVAPDAAPTVDEQTAADGGEKYVVFDLDEKSYAVHSHQVTAVFGAPAVTPLPNAPPWLAGIASLRGDMTAIVDLRRLWHRRTNAPARAKAILLRSAKTGASAAFLVDRLSEIVTLSPHDIKFSAADFEASFPAVFGRAATADGREIFLTDAENLLAALVFNA